MQELEAWEETRKKGWFNYILFNGLFMWGMPMFVAMSFISKPFAEGYTSRAAIVHYIVWPLAGLLYGAVMWWFAERRFKKNQNGSKNT
ncbi:hypothetical protein [Aliiglaciecola litoralis]|uniref:Superinfection immunity protein n=1 Tax=Aliiglaciecola litoralis TaxID=582857 RepID=A0ABP3WPE7_9ALTE